MRLTKCFKQITKKQVKTGLGLALLALVFIAPAPLTAYTAQAAPSLKVAMVLWRGETSGEAGFRAGLAELGYQVEFTVLDAAQSMDRLEAILKDLDPEKYDYIYTFGTTVSLAVKARLKGRVPQIFNIVSFPVMSSLAVSWENPGPNIGGVGSSTPMDQVLALAVSSFNPRRVGLVYNIHETNSQEFAVKIENLAAPLGLEVVTISIQPNEGALKKAFAAIENPALGVDVLIVPQDSYLISQEKLMRQLYAKLGIPSVATIRGDVEHGALMGLTPDYYNLGLQAAQVLHQAQKGGGLGRIPVKACENPAILVNENRLKALGLTLPKEVSQKAEMVR